MVEIPIILKLRKQSHKALADAQDMIVKELYNVFDKAVLHGGTAIWRCYHGNRFSEDVDAYIPKEEKSIALFFENLEKKGFVIYKRKISANSLFSRLEFNRTVVRFEALFKKPMPAGHLAEYELSSGNLMAVYTLTPEELVKEKVDAYLKRLKVRDLFDIFFLLRYANDKNGVAKCLRRLVRGFEKPIDEKDLKSLIIEGIVPGSAAMLEYIKRGIGDGKGKTYQTN